MLRLILATAMVAVPGGALAQQADGAAEGRTPQRIRNVQLTGSETCPVAQGDEIVVCSRINPNEQFRIPAPLRNTAEVAPQNQSWTNRTNVGQQVSRVAGGIPDTCSPVGTGGQSGCALQANRAWAAERRALETNDAMVP